MRTAYCARAEHRANNTARGHAVAPPRCTVRVAAHVGVQMYGEFPSLVLSHASGYAVGAFFNQTSVTEGALRLLICCDASCRSSTTPCFDSFIHA